MKKILMFSAIATIGIAAFSGCKKSDSPPGPSMKATINGVSYSSSSCLAVNAGGQLLVESGNNGSSLTYPSIELAVSNYTGAGTYTISPSSSSIYGIDSTSSSAIDADAQGGSGTVTITSASSSSMSGTFSFICTNGTTVTGGSFTANVE